MKNALMLCKTSRLTVRDDDARKNIQSFQSKKCIYKNQTFIVKSIVHYQLIVRGTSLRSCMELRLIDTNFKCIGDVYT